MEHIHSQSNHDNTIRWKGEEGENRNDDGGEMTVKEKKEKVWKVFRSEKDKAES